MNKPRSICIDCIYRKRCGDAKRNLDMVTCSGYKWESIFEKITKIVGFLFFGGWILTGTFFYIKAVIDFLI